ncbi:SDR family oxidoreductase [Candidatus Obscuribacterales bacterium]|nr:SDR family oxidoreductase [Candidatus Obscuribacterales bacterium]MBX3148720.1 SDR family oxidoreductase [Candidatus Obscuribacterales bacterium]
MKGKRCLITGATAGIGEVAAVEIARQGADVVIVGRNENRCKNTLAKMIATEGGGDLSYFVADLSSRQSVIELAQQYKEKFDRLDVLVNNAGAVFFKDERSVDGLEMTWALNHFGYFWLTEELLDLIKESAPSRIINVSSDAHKRARLNPDHCIDEKNRVPYFTYGNSKLANILFTVELSKRLSDTSVTANSMHPGVVSTNFGANNGIPGRIFNLMTAFVSITAEEGAKTIIYLATSPEVDGVSGNYFVKEKVVASSKESQDAQLARKLWQQSEQTTREIDAHLKRVTV